MVGRTHQNRSRITNSNAIIALTLGILSIFIPFAGLILGSIGIVVYRKAKNEILLTGEGGGRDRRFRADLQHRGGFNPIVNDRGLPALHGYYLKEDLQAFRWPKRNAYFFG